MPEMIPVGNTIQPPNPGQTLNTLSSILGVKQQQLALQTGQAALPGVQAQSQQQQTQATGAQISLGERQRVQQIISSGVDDQGNSILGADGKVDPDKAMQWMPRVAPTTYPQYLQNIQTTQANKLALSQAGATLGQTYRDQIGSILQTGINDPSFNSQKAAALLTPYGAQNPDAAPAVSSALALLKNLDSVQGDPKTALAKKNDMLVHVIQSLKPSAGNAPGSIDTGAAVVPGSTQPLTGTFTPSGPAVTKAPGPAGGPAYQEQLAFKQAQGAQFATRQQSGIAMANQSPQALDALSRARAILDQGTWTGGGVFSLTKELKNTLAGIGFDTESATNANELVKNLARYEATRANGVGNTDAARNLVSTGSPSTIVDSQAAKNIITQSMANEMAIKGYANKVGPVGSPQEGMQKEQEFRNTPNLIEGYEYGLMRSPEEADQFSKRYGLTKQQIAETRAKMRQQGLL